MLVDASQFDAEYQRGHQAHMAGDLDAATLIYERILADAPDHAPTLNAMCNIQLRRGRLDEAEALIRRALEVDELGVSFNTSLGNVLMARGLLQEARSAFEAELHIRPDFAIAHNQLGTLASIRNDHSTACTHYRNALRHAPQFAVAANNLGRALHSLRRHDDAEEAFRRALSIDADFAEAHANLADTLRVTGKFEEARRGYDRAIALDPRQNRAHRGLGQLALAQGRASDAIKKFAEAIACDPSDVEAYSLLAATYFREGLILRSQDAYAKALDLSPDDPDLLCSAAAVSRAAGDTDVARERYKSALVFRTTHQDALAGFAMLMAEEGNAKAAAARLAPTVNSGRASPQLLSSYANILGQLDRRREGIALLESALEKRVPPEVATQLHFALASLLDGEGSYDLAFFHCRRANEERRTQFDSEAFLKYIDAIIQAVPGDGSTLPKSDWSGPDVLLLVGLPRSGVRVLGRVLSPHTKIRVLGASAQVEDSVLDLWREVGATWPEVPATATAQDVSRAAHQAMSGRLSVGSGEPMVADPTWRNFYYLGVAASLFPNVRVIECTRDARDIARSCYFSDFSTSRGLPFSYDLRHIAAYVNGYRRLMQHWSNSGIPVHRLNYERLVLEPKQECQRLSDFLGLPHRDEDYALPGDAPGGEWHLDAKALRRYRHYRSHLEVFTDALDAPPDA